jgi:AmmeMemoRadiSam system protein A
MSSLRDSERRALLIIARQALVEATEHRREAVIHLAPEVPRAPAGAFVTLWKHKKLRGCVGQLEANEPLARVVAHCAFGASLDDPRFEPVAPAELPELEIEIPVLSAPIWITHSQVKAQVKIGEHGLLISRGSRRGAAAGGRGTGLERRALPGRNQHQGGLPRDAWRDPNARIEAFTAEAFSEADFADLSAA